MTAEIIPFASAPAREKQCSFCRTPQGQAKKLISSGVTNHCICDKCITKAKERLEGAKKP
jgi:hypothetical protein